MPLALHVLAENKLLAALPKRQLTRFAPHLEPVELAFGRTLFDADEPIDFVYFPTSGLVSLLLILREGMAEVGRIGREGMVGLPVFFGVQASQTRAFVQIAGAALRIRPTAFRQHACLGGPLGNVLLRYSQALVGHTERLTACNTWHTVEQRLCRWLLVTHDRVQADRIEVTQQFLAQMLGTHRQSVTLAARRLQRAGLIRYSRGKLQILDRAGLEHSACDCYGHIRRQYDQLLAAIAS